MKLRVVIAMQDADKNLLTASADLETTFDGEDIDRREVLLALGDQARLQFDIIRGAKESEI